MAVRKSEGIIPFGVRYLCLVNNGINFIQLALLKVYLASHFSVLKNKQLRDGAVKEACEGLQRVVSGG